MIDYKHELKELFRYYEYRLDNGCTMEEARSAFETMVENMEINGTIGDFANHFGKSKDAVNSVIKRRMIAKPKRNVVLYPFHKFLKIVPESWHRKG